MKKSIFILIVSLCIISSCAVDPNQKNITGDTNHSGSQIELAPNVQPVDFTGSIPTNSKE